MNIAKNFKNLIFDAKSQKVVLFYMLKNESSFTEIEKILKTYKNHPLTKKFLHGIPLPKKYKELRQTRYLYINDDFIKEIEWNYLSIREFNDEINKFLGLKDQYEKYLLIADYSNAEIILKKIEDEISVSIWSAEQSLILAEYQGGNEKNWEVRNSFQDNQNENTFLLLSHFFSAKAEKDYSANRYIIAMDHWIREQVKQSDQAKYYESYLLLKLNPFIISALTYTDFVNFLFIESISSIIDRYLSLIRVCSYVQGNQTDKKFADRIDELLSKLKEKINDNCLDQILLINNPLILKDLHLDEKVYLLYEEYSKGNYHKAISLSESLIRENPNVFEYLEILVKSKLLSGETNFEITGESIIEKSEFNLLQFLSKGEESDDAYNDLLKISYTLSSSNWGFQLFSFIFKYNNDIFLKDFKSKINYDALRPVFSKVINPKLTECITDNQLQNHFFLIFKEKLAEIKIFPYELLNEISSTDFTLKGNAHFVQIQLKFVKYLIRQEEYIRAIKILNVILYNHSTISYLTEKIYYYLYVCYFKNNEYIKCIRLYIDGYLVNKNYTKRLDGTKLVDVINEKSFSILPNIGELIELPLFYFLNENDSQLIYFAYDEFLFALGIARPSELENSLSTFHHEKLVMFLKDVCTIETMLYSTNFEGTEDIENERIKICQLLTSVDHKNIKEYREEISEIIQKQSIRKAIKHVDESKIYVNVDNLKNSLVGLLKGNFERYINIKKYNQSNEFKSLDNIILFDFSSEDEAPSIMRFSDRPMFLLFKEMFIEIRNRFISSNEYGLDAYLSTRIRHGTLQNNIRSIFEISHLITERNDSGNYNENTFWKQKYSALYKESAKLLQKELAEFSGKINHITRFLREECMQIKTETKNPASEALFDFSYSNHELIKIYNEKFDSIVDYEQFVSETINQLWLKTEDNLKVIRHKFSVNLKREFIDTITSFQKKLAMIDTETALHELDSALASSGTKMQDELTKISRWFKITEKEIANDFTIQTIIDTSLQITNNIYPESPINPLINIDCDLMIRGEYFNHFIDIIRILLDNIVRHSKIESENLKANIEIWTSNEKINLYCINNISESINQTELGNKLLKIKEIWQEEKVADLNQIRTEGGTGFSKIKKILAYDLHRKNNSIDFLIKDNSFESLIEFDFINLIVL